MKKALYLLVFVILIFSCQKEESAVKPIPVDNYFSLKDFPAKEKIQLQLIDSLDVGVASSILLKDSLLFLNNGFTEDYFINIYNLEGKLINKAIRKGKGPNELLSVFFIDIIDSLFYTYDGFKKNYLYSSNLADVIKKRNPKIKLYVGLGIGFTRIKTLIDKSKFISACDTDKYLLYIQDTNKRILKKIAKINIGGNLTKAQIYYLKTAFQHLVTISPARKKIAIFFASIDVFGIYDTNGVKIYSAQGPDNFDIYGLDYKKIDKFKSYVYTDKKNRWGYTEVKSYGKYIFALYNGQYVYKDNYFENYKLLVFNWNGKPVKYFEFNVPVQNFAIDYKNKIIYAFNYFDRGLYKGKFNLD